ncbi:MAG: lamin tail domain-containing protein [Candidatus Thermoplasmatota archaeon]|jgi:hypothetical protein|nr:lamin tail domain-containing protein [Candidatus Thermoplasmatota archaeon]
MNTAKKTNKKYSFLRTICLGLIALMLIMNFPAISGTEHESITPPVKSNRANADHLLLSEVCVTPSTGEFIEIYNPTEGAISLDNYFIADIIDYYNIVNTSTGFNHTYATDFLVSFPVSSTIPSGGYQVMAMNSTDFIAEYSGTVPNYCIEGVESPHMNDTFGFMGGSAGLTDGGETVVLFYWDGTSDQIKDVDIVWWGSSDAYKIDKSSVSIDSEYDGDGATSNYNNDASTYPPIKNGAHSSGNSFNRTVKVEPEEVQNGGNGKTGHDETTENLTASWSSNTEANPMTTVPPRSPPNIRSVVQIPDGNPTPGTNVMINVTVTDDGEISSVNISISVGDGTAELYPMNHVEGDDYSYTISYNSPPMNAGTIVQYNVSATDDEGNVTYSDNFTYTYLTEPVFIVTEVMFDGLSGEDDWVEIFCVDDGNSSSGISLDGWGMDDMDSDYDKTFGDVIVRTGEIILVRYNDDTSVDDNNDTDGNGIINTYTGASNTRLKTAGDQVVLFDESGYIVDAVCWAFNGTLDSGETNDLTTVFDENQWISQLNTSCVNSEDVPEGGAISRSKGEADSNSKNDWHVLEPPTPGSFGNLSNLPPVILSVLLDPMPEDGTVMPMVNVTLTARITDELGILSANITWTLNGTPQQNIPLMNDGIVPDINIGDENWTAILPGQPAGSVVVLSVEAYDTTLERRISASTTLRFTEPPEVIKVLIMEVMFDDKDTDDDWVELYCVDDGNKGGGNYITGWSVDDMDGDTDKVFGNVSIHTGDLVLIHYNDDITSDENNSSDGNVDSVIDLYTFASNTRMKMEGDQIALYDQDHNIVDSVCWWMLNRTISSGTEPDDMAVLFAAGQWTSSENTSCVNTDDFEEGWSISRIRAEPDTNSKIDWQTLKTPTPGEGPASPVPFSFNFTVLMTGPSQAPVDGNFVLQWSVSGDTSFVEQTNISLYYYEDDLDGTGIFLAYLNPASQRYVWNLTGLKEGVYYIQVLIDDGIKAPYTINTSYALEILELMPPEVESTVPSNLAVGVKIDSDIKMVFDIKMDIGSFKLGDTFTITPIVDGNFIVEDEKTVIFDPMVSMAANTLYEITLEGVMSADGVTIENSYSFTFTTEILHLYEIKGTVVPKDVTVSIDGIEVDVTNGQFSTLLLNGTYRIVISADGYEDHVELISIYGGDKDLGEIKMEELPTEMHEVPRLGPFVYKGTTKPIEGVNLSLELYGVTYYADTDSDGYARFILPVEEIPVGTTITARKGDETKSWKWGEDDLYKVFVKPDDGINGNGNDTDKGSDTTLWTILIILVVLIVAVIIVIVIYLLRTKKKDIETGSTPNEPIIEQEEGTGETTDDGTEIEVRQETLTGENTDDIKGSDDLDQGEQSTDEVSEDNVEVSSPTIAETASNTPATLNQDENQVIAQITDDGSQELALENVFESTPITPQTISDEELLDEGS